MAVALSINAVAWGAAPSERGGLPPLTLPPSPGVAAGLGLPEMGTAWRWR
jgi:hypothetical protein